MSIAVAAKRLTEILNAQIPAHSRSMVIKTSHDADGNTIQEIHVAAREPFRNQLLPPAEIDGYAVKVVPWED